jgi:hypothetical protein
VAVLPATIAAKSAATRSLIGYAATSAARRAAAKAVAVARPDEQTDFSEECQFSSFAAHAARLVF